MQNFKESDVCLRAKSAVNRFALVVAVVSSVWSSAEAAEFCVQNTGGFVIQTYVQAQKDGTSHSSWMKPPLLKRFCETYENGTKLKIYTNVVAGPSRFCQKEWTLERNQTLVLSGTALSPVCQFR